jgi:hypothetical protein
VRDLCWGDETARNFRLTLTRLLPSWWGMVVHHSWSSAAVVMSSSRLASCAVLLLAAVCCVSLVPSPSSAQICTAAPPLPPVVKVAILVFCNGPVGILDTNPQFSSMCAPDMTGTGQSTVKMFNLGQNTTKISDTRMHEMQRKARIHLPVSCVHDPPCPPLLSRCRYVREGDARSTTDSTS